MESSAVLISSSGSKGLLHQPGFFISDNILWLLAKQSYSKSPFSLRLHLSLAFFLICEETFVIYCQTILDI